jgi:hypothetical protein
VSRVGVAAGASPQFAHPVEFELGRVFDRFGMEWRYETPHLRPRAAEGRVVEACTPDFYLPELDTASPSSSGRLLERKRPPALMPDR